MKTSTGKGSGPRQGQYTKKNLLAYHKAYDRIFGKPCCACYGRGYTYDSLGDRETCEFCKGTGRVKA